MLTFNTSGSVPFGDLTKANLHAESTLKDVRMTANDQAVPVNSFDLKADVTGGKVLLRNLSVGAANSTFNVTGSMLLNDSLDSDFTLHLDGVPIERLVAAVMPSASVHTITLLDADVEFRASLTAALNGKSATPGQPLASLRVKNFHLTCDDAGDNPMEFVSCDNVAVSLSALPQPGKPIVVDQVVLTKPAIRAVSVTPGGSKFFGFANLQRIADAAAGAAPAAAPPATQPAAPVPAHPPATKLSDLFRLGLFRIDDASLYYDTRERHSKPMTLSHLAVQVTPTSQDGSSYALAVKVPDQPSFAFDLGANVNVNTLLVDGIKLDLKTDLSQHDAAFWPPQVRPMLALYQTQGQVDVGLTGQAPASDPTAAALAGTVRIDKLQVVASGNTLPVPHVRLPFSVKDRQLTVLPAQSLGGPMVEVMDGTVDLTGAVKLDDVLHSTLDLKVKDVQLKNLATAKTPPDPQLKDLTGFVNVDVHLQDAPLLTIAANTAPPTKGQPAPPPVKGKWGSGTVRITEARLAGLELIQKMNNFAKSAYFEVMKQFDREKTLTVKPKENALLVFDLVDNKIAFKKITYEGEVVAVEGNGVFTLNQWADFTLKGGPLAKLGDWIKNETNSLIDYHIYGQASDPEFPHFDVKMGDGKIITDQVKDVASKAGEGVDKGVDATKKGLNKVGGILGGWLHKGDD
jgi:hypothetical protein